MKNVRFLTSMHKNFGRATMSKSSGHFSSISQNKLIQIKNNNEDTKIKLQKVDKIPKHLEGIFHF